MKTDFPMSYERAVEELADAMEAAIKRMETIQETHPDIELNVDLLLYRNALFWFRRIPSPEKSQKLWSDSTKT